MDAPPQWPHDGTEPVAESAQRKPSRWRTGWRYTCRFLATLMSVTVLSTTGYGWSTMQSFRGSTAVSDITGPELSAEDGAVDILLVGDDSRTDAQGNPLPDEVLRTLRADDSGGGNLTDTMILVRIPTDGSHISAVSFPRDTVVETKYGQHLLNATLSNELHHERKRLQDEGVTDETELRELSRAAGQKFLVQTLEEISGVDIDHYAEVNLLGFYEITKAIGGVEVCLKNATKEPKSGADFPAGRQTIEGADALAFVRQRHGLPRSDLDRVVRQQVFISGLARKVLSSDTLANPVKLTSLVNAVKKTVVLDQELADNLLDFAQVLQGIAGGDIEFHTIPVHLVGPVGLEDVTIDKREARQYVANLLLPPEERAQREKEQAELRKAREAVAVDVFNAAGVGGLAVRVRNELAAEGFGVGGAQNADATDTSVVYHAEGDEKSGQLVAESLGGLPLQPSPNLAPGQVAVYLGADYRGPGAQGFTGAPVVRLDGALRGPIPAQQVEDAQQDEAEEPTITAGEVPCVN